MKQLWCNVPFSYFANSILQQATQISQCFWNLLKDEMARPYGAARPARNQLQLAPPGLPAGAPSKITIFLGHGTKSKGTTLWPTFGARKVAQPCLLMRQLESWVSPRNVWACQKQIVRVANSRWHPQSMRNEFCTYSAWRISFCPAYCPDMVPTKTVCRRARSYSVIVSLVRMHDVFEPPGFFRSLHGRRLVMGPSSFFLLINGKNKQHQQK